MLFSILFYCDVDEVHYYVAKVKSFFPITFHVNHAAGSRL